MATLAARDAERVLRFVADAEELGGDDHPFAPHVLEQMAKLVGADWAGYHERDFIRKRHLLDHEHPSLADLWADIPWCGAAARENPLGQRRAAGQLAALRLSALQSRRVLERTPFYRDILEPAGVSDSMVVAIPAPLTHTKSFTFDRFRTEFRDRDVLLLDVLRPHLARLWRAAQTRRRLRAALVALEQASEQDAGALVLLAASGRIEFVSPAARRLLSEYFGRSSGPELPPAVTEWLESGLPTLERRLGDRRLTVDRSDDALLLEETRDELRLTPREREILGLVARGKTNVQIAELLWIAPSTVRKHLENVYAKLGVRTRTAAVTRFLGVLDDRPE